MFCQRCQIEIQPHTNGLSLDHPFYEQQESIYGRICPHCGKSINPTIKPKFIVEKEEKLKILCEKVRKTIRKRMKI